jgi:hypothetical protein
MDAKQKALLIAVKTTAARYKGCVSDARSQGLNPFSPSNPDPAAPCAERYKDYLRAKQAYELVYGPVPVTGRGEIALERADKYIGERQARQKIGKARDNCYGCGGAMYNPAESEEESEGMTFTQGLLGGLALGAAGAFFYFRQQQG